MSVVEEAIRHSILCSDVVTIDDPTTIDELRAVAEGFSDDIAGYDFWGKDADGCSWRVHIEI